MSFDLQKVLESKRALRRKLAAKPLAEKMRLLEQLSERATAIKRAHRQRDPLKMMDAALSHPEPVSRVRSEWRLLKELFNRGLCG